MKKNCPGRSRFLLLLMSAAIVSWAGGCLARNDSHNGTGNGTTSSDDIQQLYASFKADIQAQLEEGLSWLEYDEKVVNRLAQAVPSHRRFFLLEAKDDFFVAETILIRSTLYDDHKKEFQAVSKDQNAWRALWLTVLSQ